MSETIMFAESAVSLILIARWPLKVIVCPLGNPAAPPENSPLASLAGLHSETRSAMPDFAVVVFSHLPSTMLSTAGLPPPLACQNFLSGLIHSVLPICTSLNEPMPDWDIVPEHLPRDA